MVDLSVGIGSTIIGSYLNGVRAWLQMGEGNAVTTSQRFGPLLRAVNAVLIEYILGIGVVQQRELHGEGVIQIGEFYTIALL